MIQRIQSLYLFLTTVIAVLFLSGNIIEFHSGVNLLTLNAFSINRVVENAGLERLQSVTPYTILLFIIPFLSLAAIFLYKNRLNQKRLVMILIILIVSEIAATAYYYLSIGKTYNAEPSSGIKLILPVIMLILSILAYTGIMKDEKIVRSYDRLR
jgi:DMSO reductase anchor subunit